MASSGNTAFVHPEMHGPDATDDGSAEVEPVAAVSPQNADGLPSEVWNIICNDPQRQGFFVPMCQLRALLNQDVVEKALADLDQNRRVTWLSRTLRRLLAYTYWSKYFFPPRAETVRREALAICSERGLTKIFAILLLMGKPELIKDFLKEGLCDDDLPFEKVDPDIETTRIKFWLRPKRNGNKDQRPVPAFIRRWPASYLGPFADFQWSVLAPFLQTDEQQWREPFPDDTILPFTSEQRLHGGTKNRPEILKVEIHPEHHDFDKTNNIFVIKKISIDHEKVFLQELRVLNRLKHDHVIGLFAAYQHRQHYLMVLPCAKCNLAEYWEKENTRPVQNHATLAWIAIQSRGVVDGLAQLHRHLTGSTSSLHEQESGASTVLPSNRAPVREYYGRHGDIKPENLLWFPGSPGNPGDMGIIKIADFGESRYSSTESALQDTRKLKYTLPYRPPEFRLDRSNQPKPISATSDTWALGCVFLEFISWYDGGWQRLEQFVSLRKQQTGKGRRYREPTSGYFRLSKVEPMDNNMEPSQYAELKPSVTSQFDILRRNLAVESNRFSELIRRFLALIQEHMLVIEPYRTSESGQFYRYTSKEVFEELDKIIRDHLDEVQAASD